MIQRKKKKHRFQFFVGCVCLVIGVALVGANLSVSKLNRVDLMEGIVLILVGGYMLGNLVWSS
ncbi:MAG TPA: hypothetical protein VJG90_02450 [Candidatus Nanoarchaeia archaeon]|nr:hypothetical protein [Candidatus Nanoarchaeia archaeon]